MMQDRLRLGSRKIVTGAIITGIVGFIFQVFIVVTFRQYTPDGIHFQEWSSESMMQSVALEDLYSEPWATLWNIHIQPPALDAIRAVLVQLWPSSNPLVAVAHVDILLYGLWSLLYGIMGSLFFIWIYQLSGVRLAIIGASVFFLHPATLFFATFLEATFLSAFLISLMYYHLWRVSQNNEASLLPASILVLLLFFTKSLFQWPFALVFAISLILVGVNSRKVLAFVFLTSACMTAYLLKQQNQFNISSTSSMAGYNLARSLSLGAGDLDFVGYLGDAPEVELNSDLPKVLTRRWKATRAINFNHYMYLPLYDELMHSYLTSLRTYPFGTLIQRYQENLELYMRASSNYTSHIIVDRLPWRATFDRVFSSWILGILLAVAGIHATREAFAKGKLASTVGLALPAAYIIAVSIMGDKGENMRFKYFIEPVMIVFITYQLSDLVQRFRFRHKEIPVIKTN